jgi:hypothetical protein
MDTFPNQENDKPELSLVFLDHLPGVAEDPFKAIGEIYGAQRKYGYDVNILPTPEGSVMLHVAEEVYDAKQSAEAKRVLGKAMLEGAAQADTPE